MQIILVTQRHGKSVHLPQWLGRSLPYLTLMASAALFYSGYHTANEQQMTTVSPRALAQWEQEIAGQRDDLEALSRRSEEELAALMVRLAELQARSSRLDALGERLIEVAGLQDSEFDFSLPPGVGGPAMIEDVSTEISSLRSGGLRPPSFTEELDRLGTHLDSRRQQLSVLESLLTNRMIESQTFVAGRPVRSGGGAWMSSRYGYRSDPFNGSNSWHAGLDFAGREGTEIVAVAAGVVVHSGERGGYGNMVEINHGSGYTTRYAHNKENLVEL
ncbi:MAG: M23 family metallopeptidase, partial [Natronospirillum sp.]